MRRLRWRLRRLWRWVCGRRPGPQRMTLDDGLPPRVMEGVVLRRSVAWQVARARREAEGVPVKVRGRDVERRLFAFAKAKVWWATVLMGKDL